MDLKPTKRFFRKWRKRNGEGCTYGLIDGGCNCAGPMACEHGAKGATRLNADSLRLRQDDAEKGQGTGTLTTKAVVPYLLTTASTQETKYATQTNLPLVHTAALNALKRRQKKPKAVKSSGGGWVHKCDLDHDGDKMLFKINDSEIYASTIWKAARMTDAALVIQCTADVYGTAGDDKGFQFPKAYEVLRGHVMLPQRPPTIVLPWQDYGLPPVYMSFWGELIHALPKGKVVIACVGSHGRTGTALAALLITHQRMTADEAIGYVRTHHCEHAIESKGQEEYLRALARMNGNDVKPQPSTDVN